MPVPGACSLHLPGRDWRAGNLNQTRLLSPSHPSTWTVTQCPCSGKSTWLENQALNGASIPPWAGFRHFGDPADLRLTIRNRASGPAPVATIRSPSSGYLRSTSVVPPCYLRSTSVWHTEVLRRYYGGSTEVLRRYSQLVVGRDPIRWRTIETVVGARRLWRL